MGLNVRLEYHCFSSAPVTSLVDHYNGLVVRPEKMGKHLPTHELQIMLEN